MPQLIDRELIRPNDWNVNAFDPVNYPKLVESIREKGILEPLKVMPDPGRRPGSYLMVDGYHRWKAATDLGIQQLPCEVWEISPEEAKVRGLQLNYLRGEPVPRRLAALVHDLNSIYSLDDLSKILPWSENQLSDALTLLRMPAGVEARLAAQVAEKEAAAPIPVTVVLLGTEHEQFERAMAAAKERLGKGMRRGQCLAEICKAYIQLLGPE